MAAVTTLPLPMDIRSLLLPYADAFDYIVAIISDKHSSIGRSPEALRTAIDDFQIKYWPHEVHPMIMFYGLQLCCYYARKEAMSKQKIRSIKLARDVWASIRAAYKSRRLLDHMILY